MLQWLKYFLTGIAQTSEEASMTLSKILELKNNLEKQIQTGWGRRANTALILLDYLFRNPVVHIKKIEEVSGLSFKTANNLASDFEKAGILKEMTGQSRNRIFVFETYVNLFK
ncbi:MAG: hypothetical protein D6714_16150 [Bacteroidetes bacterium]|nr:MAG: hypothetical protein D6714_16150 [Bacteroidota bacterium]